MGGGFVAQKASLDRIPSSKGHCAQHTGLRLGAFLDLDRSAGQHADHLGDSSDCAAGALRPNGAALVQNAVGFDVSKGVIEGTSSFKFTVFQKSVI